VKLYILFLLVLSNFLYGNISKKISIQNNLLNQKRVHKKLQNLKNLKIPHYKVKKPKIVSSKQNQKCFYIKKIEIKSATILKKDVQNSILKRYINRCDTLQDIKNLINKLSTVYIDKGYITSKVFLKPQNLSKGVLKLFVIEGKIDLIKPQKLYIKDVFLKQKGEILDLRKLEDSLELINRLPSNHATMKLLPSKKMGYTDILIKNRATKRVSGVFQINNFGTKITGKEQGSLSLSLDNILGINDQFTFGLNGTDKQFSDENAKGDSFGFSFPIGRVLNSFNYTQTSYKELVPASITRYKLNGESQTFSYALSYKLFHNQKNSLKIATSIAHSKNKNYIQGTFIQTSSYSLSHIDFNLDYLYKSSDFYSLVSLGYEKGTKWFGTDNPTTLDERYSLYSVDLSLQKSFDIVNYLLQAHYQHTKDRLFSNSRISIGGAYSVRGYEDEGLSGNSGYYFRNELSKTLGFKLFKKVSQIYFIALDGGHIKKQEDSTGGNLLSYALGIKLSNKEFNSMVYYAKPIYKDSVTAYRSFVGFSLEYIF